MDDTDAGEASSLLLSQSTLLQFAAISMLQSLKALLQSIDEESDTELFKLAFEAWNVLATVLHNDIWTSGSASAGELVWFDCFYPLSCVRLAVVCRCGV